MLVAYSCNGFVRVGLRNKIVNCALEEDCLKRRSKGNGMLPYSCMPASPKRLQDKIKRKNFYYQTEMWPEIEVLAVLMWGGYINMLK